MNSLCEKIRIGNLYNKLCNKWHALSSFDSSVTHNELNDFWCCRMQFILALYSMVLPYTHMCIYIFRIGTLKCEYQLCKYCRLTFRSHFKYKYRNKHVDNPKVIMLMIMDLFASQFSCKCKYYLPKKENIFMSFPLLREFAIVWKYKQKIEMHIL